MTAKTTSFLPEHYSRAPGQCGLCTEVAPFLTTSADGKSTTVRYECIHHTGPLSPPADWIYQYSPHNTVFSAGDVPLSDTDMPETNTREERHALGRQSAARDYMLYVCPGHEVMDQLPRDTNGINQDERQLESVEQTIHGMCGEIQTDGCNCGTHTGLRDQFGEEYTVCDCVAGGDLVACTQQQTQHAGDKVSGSDIITRDSSLDYLNQSQADIRFMNINAPPAK